VFLAGWGGLAMLTAAPLDNWWHAAYGLDVTIVSLPHAVLVLGLRAVSVGMLFLILAEMNRAAETGASNFGQMRALFLYLGGLIVVGQMFFLLEFTADVMLHTSRPYFGIGIMIPVVFAMLWQASRFRWAATTAALVYTIFVIAEILILPLFPAQPKLGPVFYPVTHFVPEEFPILILAPAIALDVLWQRTGRWETWKIAAVSGFVFVGLLVAVEWPFADFLMSPASANRFFGTIYFDYSAHADGLGRMRRFYKLEGGERLALGMIKAAFAASISAWAGLKMGRWMRGLQR
jgi:hypothetical protein